MFYCIYHIYGKRLKNINIRLIDENKVQIIVPIKA